MQRIVDGRAINTNPFVSCLLSLSLLLPLTLLRHLFCLLNFPFFVPVRLIFHDGLFLSEAFGYTPSLYKISTLYIYFKIATAAK